MLLACSAPSAKQTTLTSRCVLVQANSAIVQRQFGVLGGLADIYQMSARPMLQCMRALLSVLPDDAGRATVLAMHLYQLALCYVAIFLSCRRSRTSRSRRGAGA